MAGPRRRLLVVSLLAVAALGGVWATTWADGDAEPAGTGPSSTLARPALGATTAPTMTTVATTATSTVDVAAIAPTDRFVPASGRSAVAGTGPLRTYVVEVEEGLPVEAAELAEAVDATLADPRGWTARGDVSLQRVGPEDAPSFRVRLATPGTVDARCAPLRTDGIFSCRQGSDVMINARRWFEGAAESQLSLADYRHYVISHEVGHALGHGHVDCPAPGAVAPVMMQQTKGLDGCAANPWPYP
jgi:hypothetical protein